MDAKGAVAGGDHVPLAEQHPLHAEAVDLRAVGAPQVDEVANRWGCARAGNDRGTGRSPGPSGTPRVPTDRPRIGRSGRSDAPGPACGPEVTRRTMPIRLSSPRGNPRLYSRPRAMRSNPPDRSSSATRRSLKTRGSSEPQTSRVIRPFGLERMGRPPLLEGVRRLSRGGQTDPPRIPSSASDEGSIGAGRVGDPGPP